MKILELDASELTTTDNAFEGLMRVLEAPEWHGRNLNALRDSIMGDDLNGVRAPFEIRIKGQPSEAVRQLLGVVEEIFEEARQHGVNVRLASSASNGL
jgi:RNAse (barnase) inhibitor barstar